MPARKARPQGRPGGRGRESVSSEPGAVPEPWETRRVAAVDYETLFNGEMHELRPGIDFCWPEVSLANGPGPCPLDAEWERRYAVPDSGIYFAAPGWSELSSKLRIVAAAMGGTWVCEQNGGKYWWQYRA